MKRRIGKATGAYQKVERAGFEAEGDVLQHLWTQSVAESYIFKSDNFSH